VKRGLTAADTHEGNLLAGAPVLKEVGDIVFHIIHVQLAVVVKILEMRFVAVQVVGYLLPVMAVDGLVLVGQLQQKLVEVFLRPVAATGDRQRKGQECNVCDMLHFYQYRLVN